MKQRVKYNQWEVIYLRALSTTYKIAIIIKNSLHGQKKFETKRWKKIRWGDLWSVVRERTLTQRANGEVGRRGFG